ncbi:hypothetical protein LCM10_08225 [Rossellomorea aquimaris]|uniref:hypothetical protein n=1 Tax=Rossellomorea aquimaris TaxID=189382 RepID=UPI001CD33ABE|nr:hypothetical protein [Rossellomorea aquimaris]MCA1054968.1 hypothetical protein [Rossellomorea aquimaris]
MNIETLLAGLSYFILAITSILSLVWKNSDEALELKRQRKDEVDFLSELILFRQFNRTKLKREIR